jgi:energy-converting hydrogenase A subunit M
LREILETKKKRGEELGLNTIIVVTNRIAEDLYKPLCNEVGIDVMRLADILNYLGNSNQRGVVTDG